jgi:hypothetical protein
MKGGLTGGVPGHPEKEGLRGRAQRSARGRAHEEERPVGGPGGNGGQAGRRSQVRRRASAGGQDVGYLGRRAQRVLRVMQHLAP